MGDDASAGSDGAGAIERRLAEDDSRPLDARFRTLADSAPMIIWACDSVGRHKFANRAFVEFMGVARAQFDNFDWRQSVHPDDLPAYNGAFLQALRARKPFHGRARVRRWDGAWRWLETRGNPQLDASGQVIGYIGCSPDVTEIIQSQSALEEAARRKDEFLAVLSHELRNPLASITSGTRLLRVCEPGEAESIREMVEREALQLTRLVEDLLDVSRATAGRIELRKERLDLRLVVREAVEMNQPFLDRHSHHVTVTLPGTPLPVEGDPGRLIQVVSNLINNAAKYSPQPGEIRVAVALRDGEVEVRVADDGIGIAPEDLPRIFDLFSRIDRSDAHAEGGLGIGLSLARRLTEMHAGSLEAHSSGPGEGSEFVLRLPMAAGVGQEAAWSPRDTPGPTARNRRVLVIDDNVAFATAVSGLLRAMGHEVRTLHEGGSSLEAARVFHPAVVLLDIGLPGVTGYDLARRLRADPKLARTKIIAMTGYAQEQDRQRAQAAGFDHFLTKPVDDVALAALIEQAGYE